MTGSGLKRKKPFSGREKGLLVLGTAVLAIVAIRWMVVDFPQRVVADREVWMQQSVRDTLWLQGKRAALTCLSQQINGKPAITEGIPALNPPETLKVDSVIHKENTLFITVNFREHVQLLEWLLQVEASNPLRVTMLHLNDAMDKADIRLSGVDCYDL